MDIFFDKVIAEAAPELRVIVVEADVRNNDTPDGLWREIMDAEQWVRDNFPMDRIRHRPAIAATRDAYKALGKEPNRYRPSAEALCRRAVKGMELYRTATVIDLINLLSILSGYSIGGFDADKIVGESLTLGVGQEGEPYEAIGRGSLNIEHMPVFRDSIGGIGTPTSDNERTKLTSETRRLLMTVNIYGQGEFTDDEFLSLTERLLRDYASTNEIIIKTWNVRI